MGSKPIATVNSVCAHIGNVTSGSLDVFAGGMAVARKGDPHTCSTHGNGAIVSGSTTVFINGLSVARMGDKTLCGTPPTPPQATPLEDETHFITAAKKINSETGQVETKHPEKVETTALWVGYTHKDTDGDGNYDSINAGFNAADFSWKDVEWNPLGEDYTIIGTKGNINAFKGEFNGTLHGPGFTDGSFGYEGKAEAQVVGGNVSVYIGEEGLYYGGGNAGGKLLYAEAEAKEVLYTGGEESRYGYMASAGAKAGVATGDLTGKISTFFFESEAKIGGSVGEVGIGASGGFWIDTDDWLIHAEIGGELAALLGIKADLKLTVGDTGGHLKKWLFGEPEPPVPPDGNIIFSPVIGHLIFVGD